MKRIKLTINGKEIEFSASDDYVLIDLLREHLHLTGTKQSCDRKGQCGTCTVIINGKVARACLKKVIDLEGAEIITIEGLGTPDNPHLIQHAYVLAGAVQCGFCTPGMILATKVLLDHNPDPDLDSIKQALAGNLCRCTGYKKIIEAVQLAGQFMRGEKTPREIYSSIDSGMVGVSHPRPTSMIKACGLAQFNADISLDNPLELAVARSTAYHARIKSINSSAALKMPGVVGIMTAEDIKGTNRIRYMFPDQPVLCEGVVRILGDPIAAVAADTREHARAAAAAIEIEYEPLPVMMTPEEALAPGAYQIHKTSPNLLYTQPLIKGDAEKALQTAKTVVEAEFSTQMNHQAPLEPEVSSAYFEHSGEKKELVVVGRSINIHAHTAQIKEAIGFENVRYREAFSGGQFGIKTLIVTEAVTAAAALHFKQAIRYVPTLEESILITSKRHPYKMKIKMAADANGKIVALFDDLLINKGAYSAIGITPLVRSLHMLQGSYHIPNIQALGRIVYTNNGFGGAARGAGPPQSIFSLESAMDMLAEKLNIDPLQFRRMNSLTTGQTKATGMVAEEWPFPGLCDAIHPYYEKAKEVAKINNASNPAIKRGVGIAAESFGIGASGDSAQLTLEVDPDDGVTIYAAAADPGEGNDSMLTQIAAHLLNLPMNKVRLYTRDTDKTLYMGPASGSRITWMAGSALVNAIEQLQQTFVEAEANTYAGLKAKGKPTRYLGSVKNKGELQFDRQTGQGGSFVSECHNVQMAEVEVNMESGAVRVLKMTVALDAGRIIHPQNIEGQIEGGMDQGVGFALREEYILGKTKDYKTFKFPTIRNNFDMEIIFRETPRKYGPIGATGIGEMTMVSTAPAVINAIYNASGVRIFDLPATPEKIKAALSAMNR
jgi:aldehyde oxidoreductase